MREFKKLPLELFIGYDIEQNSRVIELDASEMVEKYPSGILQLVCKRPGEETTYIAPSFEQDGGTLRWTLTSYDVEKAGQGLAIVALVDTSEESVKVLASHKIRTGIEEGLHFRDAESVDPEDSLIARVLAAVSQAQAYAQDAKEEADRAEAAEDAVEDAKDQAISDIETKGAETLDSIPSDYTALSGDVSDLKNTTTKLSDAVTNTLGVDDYVFCGRVQARSTSGKDDPINGNRLRIYYGKMKKGTIIKAQTDFGAGTFFGTWSSPGQSLRSYEGNCLQVSGHSYSHDLLEMTLNQDGYLTLSVNKSDGTVFTDSELQEALNSLHIEISIPPSEDNTIIDIEKSMEENKYQELYQGEFANAKLTAKGLNYDAENKDFRLSSVDVTALPNGTNKVKVVINDNYVVAMRTGVSAQNLFVNLYWYKNGDTITIPDGHNYYGISMAVDDMDNSNTRITISPDRLSQIGLKLLVEDYRTEKDGEAEKLFNASRLSFSSGSFNSMRTFPVIAHTSDCHGDNTRVQNFMDFCDRVGVDVAAITGDIVAYQPKQGLSWFKTIVNNAKTLCAVCIGNHDVFDDTMSDASAYDFVFDGIEDKIGNETGKTWYYKDIAEKNIRIISVNLYEYGGTIRNYTHFTSEQLAWLCSTLASTPENYGVVLLYHSPQIGLTNAKSETYPKFFQDIRKYNNTYSGVTGSPLNDIIDAFIGRTTISRTYTQTGNPSTVSVFADFANVPSSVDFIAHLTGHFHQDSVCYVPNTTHLQLMLNVVCTNSLYGKAEYPYLCDLSDLPRNTSDITQNCFNVYVIDRDNRLVKITRIGSGRTYDMKVRDYMEIPYAD